MKASELRIGNLGCDVNKGRNVEVIGVDSTWNYVWVRYGNRSDYKIDVNDFVPHELTEDWLLKFGFINEGYDEIFDLIFRDKNGQCRITRNGSFWKYWPEELHGFCIEFEYVHQLQNLYFALTGNELCPTI